MTQRRLSQYTRDVKDRYIKNSSYPDFQKFYEN
jgi:hypothetical protein